MNSSLIPKQESNYLRSFLFLLLLFLFLLLPQINDQQYVFSTITSKFVYFLYGGLFILIVYSIILFFKKEVFISFSLLDISLLILLFYITLNRYIIQPQFGFSIRYIELIGLGFFYIVLRFFSFKDYFWILLVIVVSGIVQAIHGNLQLLGLCTTNHLGFKMTGSFFNPGPYAGFLSSVFSIALGMYLFKDAILKQILKDKQSGLLLANKHIVKSVFEYIPVLGILSILLVLPATQSRSSLLAASVSSLILLELRYNIFGRILKRANTFRKGILIAVLLSILFIGFLGLYNFKKESSNGRLFIWKVSTEMTTDFPFFGVGFDRFKVNYMNYQADYFMRNGQEENAFEAGNSQYAFNDWLQFFCENGLLGLLILVLVLVALIRIKKGNGSEILYGLLVASLSNIGIIAFFTYPVQILPIKIILITLLVMLSKMDKKKFIEIHFRKHLILKSFLIIPFIFLAYSLFLHVFLIDKSFKSWKNGNELSKQGLFDLAIDEYQASYEILKHEGGYLLDYGNALFFKGAYEKSIKKLKQAKKYQSYIALEITLGDCYKKLGNYKQAEIAYKNAIYMIPSRFYPYYLLMKLYDDCGETEKKIDVARTVLLKKVKIPSLAVEEIRTEALEILKKNDLKI